MAEVPLWIFDANLYVLLLGFRGVVFLYEIYLFLSPPVSTLPVQYTSCNRDAVFLRMTDSPVHAVLDLYVELI